MNHILTPPFVLDAYAANQLQEQSGAVCLFVDTAGFTPLTSALMAHGTEGAEVLAQVLADIFTPLLTIVYAQGGYVAGFAGDAFKAIFPGLGADSHQRAATAAWQIRQQMVAHAVQATRFGAFRFAVKITMASGPVEWCIWRAAETENSAGFQQQAALLFGGAALAQALAADPLVQAGEIVMTAAVAAQLPPAATLEAVADHFRLCAWSITTPVVAPSATHYGPAELAEHPPLANHFFPTELLDRQTQGEFRQVVTLFVNLQALPSGATATEFAGALFRLLTQYGGYLCRIGQIGDRDPGGTLLLFWGAPTSHENDVMRALHFALALPAITPTPMRIGITTALAYAGFVGSPLREEYTCYGAHVNLAARQMVMADWGEIWLDEATTHLAGSSFTVSLPAMLRFKGFAEERTVYRLLRHQSVNVERFYTGALVGRAAELAQLQNAFAPLAEGRSAGLITIIGEAGIGKSRLVYELQRQLEDDKVTRWQGDKVSHGASEPVTLSPPHPVTLPQWFRCQSDEILRQPLNPFRYWLRSYFNQSTSAEEATNKIAFTTKLDDLIARLGAGALVSRVSSLVSELDRTRSFLGALVDLHWPDSLYSQVEPQLRLENTLVALKNLILAESLRQPVILYLEDAHWLDADSQSFLIRLLQQVAEYPLAVIVTRRPGEETGRHETRDTRHEMVEGPQLTIRLTALAAEEIRALATVQLQGAPAPGLVALLLARAEGNPFFAEQLLRYLQEEGWLTQGSEGWQLRNAKATPALLPNGARALLVARLDRLPQPVKEVVQTAAVLGREFDTQVLAQMLAADATLTTKLAAADQAGIWSAINQARYLFRHALLREAAYEMQLRAQLRNLHRRAAEAMRSLFGERLDPYYAELAYHYDRAEVLATAATWYGKAGEQAANGYANHDAVRYFSRALELTPDTQPEVHFDLLSGRQAVYERLGENEARRNDITTLQKIAEQLPDVSYAAQAALKLTDYLCLKCDYKAANSIIQRAALQASERADPRLLTEIHYWWGRVCWLQGDYGAATEHLERALRLARSSQYPFGEALTLTDLGTLFFYQGNYGDARKQLADALPIYRALAKRQGEGGALAMLGSLASQSAEYEAALSYFVQAQEIFQAIGYSYGLGFIWGNLGLNYSYVGLYDEAQKMLHQALVDCRRRHQPQGESSYLDSLAVIQLQLGNYQEAYQLATEALAIQQAIHDRRFEAYSLTYQGDALAALGDFAPALLAYEQALTIRRQLGEEKLTLEILSGLARLKLAQGAIAESVALVTQILRWIDNHGIEGIEFPIQLYLTCFEILQATGDATQASPVLAAGYQLLQERAAKLQDQQLRQRFLQVVPFNRQLTNLYLAMMGR
ncbi:MAG: hypothetical protein DYG89_13885 [Caldilinea sp. CFX5]|nr:hypothetical protein [Caldilinea sp. CFX5]